MISTARISRRGPTPLCHRHRSVGPNSSQMKVKGIGSDKVVSSPETPGLSPSSLAMRWGGFCPFERATTAWASRGRSDLRPAKNLLVRIEASLNNTGLARWTFTSIDPDTGQPLPADDPDGFLPPNVNSPEGEGSVSFIVKPKGLLRRRFRFEVPVVSASRPLRSPPNAGDSASLTSRSRAGVSREYLFPHEALVIYTHRQ